MAGPEAELATCDVCGATIYPEHLQKHAAERIAGKLFCPHCLQESRHGGDEVLDVALVVDNPAPAAGAEKSYNTGGITFDRGSVKETDYRRPLLGGRNATRCRTFHCKLTDASFAHLDEMICDWVDQNDGVEVKFASSVIGVVEGKHNDPHLIVTIFY